MGWDKQSIYHSMFRKESPLTLMFTKSVQKTKYKGQNDFAPFRLPDDATEYTYQVENDEIAQAIRRAPKNTWIMVTAEGKDDEATLTIRNTDGSEIKQKQRTKASAGAGPASVEEGFWQALGLARELRARYLEEFEEELEPMIKEMATSIYINWEKGGWKPLRESEAEPEPKDEGDPDALVDAGMLKKVEDRLKKIVMEDNIRERIQTLIESGMTEKTAIQTLNYLNSLPEADDQPKLPWEEDEDG